MADDPWLKYSTGPSVAPIGTAAPANPAPAADDPYAQYSVAPPLSAPPVNPKTGAAVADPWLKYSPQHQTRLQQSLPTDLGAALEHQGFLESAWQSLKGIFTAPFQVGAFNAETERQRQQALQLEKNGTPEQKRAFAKNVLLTNIPLASTLYKVNRGNYAGAAGDVAGMVALPLISKTAAAIPEARAARVGAGVGGMTGGALAHKLGVPGLAGEFGAAGAGAAIGAEAGPMVRNTLAGLSDLPFGRNAGTGGQPIFGKPPAAPSIPLQLTAGPRITPAPPDTSFVRSAPGQYATREPLPVTRQLPAGPKITPMPKATDPSFVRAVPGQYAEVEPGFQAPETTAPEAAVTKTPGQTYAESEGYDWGKTSAKNRQLFEDIARAQSNVAQQESAPPAKTAPPPPLKRDIVATPSTPSEATVETPPEEETPPLLKKDIVATPSTPSSPQGGRLYSKSKSPHMEATSQFHALGTDMELPGSPPGRGLPKGTGTALARDLYGKNWSELTPGEIGTFIEFMNQNGRLPTTNDLNGGLFPVPGMARGGMLRFPNRQETLSSLGYTPTRYAAGGDVDEDDGLTPDVSSSINYDFPQDGLGLINLGEHPGQFGTPTKPLKLPAKPATPPRFQDPYAAGFRQMESGWQHLWEPSDTTAADPAWWDKKAQAASDVMRGSGPFLAPLAIPAAAAAPVATGLGLVAGMATTPTVEALAKKAGVSPGQAALVGDLSGLWAGTMGGELAPSTQEFVQGVSRAPGQIQDLINQLDYTGGNPERGSISPKAPKAPKVRDVKTRSIEDLEERIPFKDRAVNPDPTKLINGQSFSSLDMDAPSEGFLPYLHLGPEAAENLNQRMWEDAIRESELPGGSVAAESVRKTGARPPTAEFLHRSMVQPQRSRYWYELSGNSFTGDHIDIPREMVPTFIDNVAATSGGAKPYTNMKRALGTFSENLQNVPIYTDLRDPASVRNALNPNLERLGTHKYQNFSGTMQYTSGLDPRPPLSVNDVQMADIFGIKGSDIGSNPALYEVMSRYINKVRDAQNALLPQGAQPWEAWQIQAPTWVRNRLDKDPTSTYDDYAMVLPRIIKELNDAGVPTPNGKITVDTLMDPRTPNVMSGTRQTFMGTPTGTVEFATNKTPAGAAAAQMRAQLEQYDPSLSWVQKAKAKYEQIQRNAMTDFAQRHGDDPSFVSQLMSELTGQKLDVSRIEPNGYGTYEEGKGFDINPNLRIPMGGTGSKGFVALSKPQREAFLSILGQDLNQDGMAASHFTTVPHEPAGRPPSADRTYSVFMRRYDNQVDQNAIQEFSRQVGYPVNVSRTPNGILVDVNIADKGIGPTHEAVKDAANATFGNDDNVYDLGTIPRDYSSDFVHNSEYQEKINAHQMQRNQPGRGGRAGNSQTNFRNIRRIRQQIRKIAQQRDAEFDAWTKDAQARTQVAPRAPKPSPPPEAIIPGGATGGSAVSILNRYPSREAILRSLGG